MIATKLKHFLNKHKVAFQILNHGKRHNLKEALQYLKINTQDVIQALPITDGKTNVLAILPLYKELDFDKLDQKLHREFYPSNFDLVDKYFNDCEPRSYPPFGEPYGLSMIVDQEIENLSSIYFASGSHSSMIHMSIEEFCFLTNGVFRFPLANDKKLVT